MFTIDYHKMINEQTENIYQLSETATKIALQNFEWRYMTLLFFNSTLCYGVQYFSRFYDKVVVIGKGTFYPKFAKDARQYVLFGTDISNIVHMLEWMRAHEFDNTGKHIILCQSIHEEECDEESVIRELWYYKITNVVFLKNINNNVTGFTYFPLSNSGCNHHGAVRLSDMMSCLDFQKPCNIFPMKLANLNRCPLVASTFIQPPYMDIKNGIPSGADGDFLRLLMEKLNGSLVMMTPRMGTGWGNADENGTWSGSLGDVYYEYANLSITSAALTTGRYLSFHLSSEYGTISVIWITHTAKIIPSSLKLTYPFQQESRIALTISFTFVVIIAIFIQTKFWMKFSRKIQTDHIQSGIVFYSWMICMGLPTTRLPKKTAFLFIVLMWIWYGVLIRTLYQASLITTMKSNYYYKEIDSLDYAIELNYPYGGGTALKEFFVNDQKVFNHWRDMNAQDIIPTLRMLAEGMEYILAINIETAKKIIWEEQIHVHILNEKIATSPTVIFFKKFSPIAAAVNNVLVTLIESGFSDKFYRDHTSRFNVHKAESPLQSITLSDYAGCFAVLLLGWVVSCLFFVTEILFHKVHKRYKTLR